MGGRLTAPVQREHPEAWEKVYGFPQGPVLEAPSFEKLGSAGVRPTRCTATIFEARLGMVYSDEKK